jgi:hypothetical protein
MKPLSRLFAIAALTIALVFVAHIQVFADTYYTATFTGGVQWPTGGGSFDGITWDPAGVSGNFVYDGTLIPGPGTGWVNVFFDNTSAGGFPDVGSIPAGTLFTIHLGATPLTFTFADANLEPFSFPPYHDAAIQYNNGNFNGFFFVADFQYGGSSYRFDDEGGTWGIYLLVGGIPSTEYAYGYINNMTATGPYAPPSPPVPVPPTVLLLGPGLAGLAAMRGISWGSRPSL